MVNVLCAQIVRQRHKYKQMIAHIIIMSQVQVSPNKLTLPPSPKYMHGAHLMLVSCSCLKYCCALINAPLRLQVMLHVGTSTTMLTVSPVFIYDSPSIYIHY